MTHDELLAKIDDALTHFDFNFLNALRAVVEATKTQTGWDGGWEDAEAFQSGYDYAMHIIKTAVEKELG